jgi:hypothetical protein
MAQQVAKAPHHQLQRIARLAIFPWNPHRGRVLVIQQELTQEWRSTQNLDCRIEIAKVIRVVKTSKTWNYTGLGD